VRNSKPGGQTALLFAHYLPIKTALLL